MLVELLGWGDLLLGEALDALQLLTGLGGLGLSQGQTGARTFQVGLERSSIELQNDVAPGHLVADIEVDGGEPSGDLGPELGQARGDDGARGRDQGVDLAAAHAG